MSVRAWHHTKRHLLQVKVERLGNGRPLLAPLLVSGTRVVAGLRVAEALLARSGGGGCCLVLGVALFSARRGAKYENHPSRYTTEIARSCQDGSPPLRLS